MPLVQNFPQRTPLLFHCRHDYDDLCDLSFCVLCSKHCGCIRHHRCHFLMTIPQISWAWNKYNNLQKHQNGRVKRSVLSLTMGPKKSNSLECHPKSPFFSKYNPKKVPAKLCPLIESLKFYHPKKSAMANFKPKKGFH